MAKVKDSEKMDAKYEELRSQMVVGNTLYDSWIAELAEQDRKAGLTEHKSDASNISLTWFWKWTVSNGDQSTDRYYFINRPPISEAPLSERILIAGTNIDFNSIKMEQIAKTRLGITEEQVNKKPFVYSRSISGFWWNFFDEELYLDKREKISIPKAMVTAGEMRSYTDGMGGESINVGNKLEEYASL